MNEDILAYLLNGLEGEDRAALEQELEANPAARQSLVKMRRALSPLEVDRDDSPAPPYLVARTLERTAGLPPPGSTIKLPTGPAMGRSIWRRADVVVAASIAFLVLLMIPPGMLKLQHSQNRLACADNLHQFHAALAQYEQDHGSLPRPHRNGRLAVAGVFPATLRQAGYWDEDRMRITCPANSQIVSQPYVPTVDELEIAPDGKYDQWRQTMGGCYAFPIGYINKVTGEYMALDRNNAEAETPVMGDRPPRRSELPTPHENSPNHAGAGQNVLFWGGHVRFQPRRMIGFDDIFLNAEFRPAAGHGPKDAVLVPSEVEPFPPE